MIVHKWIGNPPTCKTCGKEMKEWNFYAEEHEHTECAADRLAERLIKALTNQLQEE